MIHIIGGFGSLVSHEVHTRIIQRAKINHLIEDNEYPSYVIHNTPLAKSDFQGVHLSERLVKYLEQIPTDEKIIMACNTLYCYKELSSFSNVIHLPAKIADANSDDEVIILQSEFSEREGLYQRYFPKYQAHDMQSEINEAIKKIMEHNNDLVFAEKVWKLASKCKIVLGCTELSLLKNKDSNALHTHANILDSLDYIVREVYDEA